MREYDSNEELRSALPQRFSMLDELRELICNGSRRSHRHRGSQGTCSWCRQSASDLLHTLDILEVLLGVKNSVRSVGVNVKSSNR